MKGKKTFWKNSRFGLVRKLDGGAPPPNQDSVSYLPTGIQLRPHGPHPILCLKLILLSSCICDFYSVWHSLIQPETVRDKGAKNRSSNLDNCYFTQIRLLECVLSGKCHRSICKCVWNATSFYGCPLGEQYHIKAIIYMKSAISCS